MVRMSPLIFVTLPVRSSGSPTAQSARLGKSDLEIVISLMSSTVSPDRLFTKKNMMAEKQDYWIPPLAEKQYSILNNYARYLLVEGAKYSGKTVGILHKICRHMYETDRAEVGCFSKIIKSARNTGSFQLLLDVVVPMWINAGVFKYVKQPTTDSVTKTPYFIVDNMHGTTSKCSLFSCDNEDEVEERAKGTSFSMIWFLELSNFSSRIVFDATITQLRMYHLPYEAHQWVADTNPPIEGEFSWIHDIWFKTRFAESDNPDDELFRSELDSIHFSISDNPFLDKRIISSLKAAYGHSKDLTDRYVHGLWTASSDNSIFGDVWLPNIHVQGEALGQIREDWEVIVPTRNCYELFLGFDLGDTNHSAHIATKRIVGDNMAFDVIDELVVLQGKVSIEDFTLAMVDKVNYWEDYIRDNYGADRKILLRCWSDSSAFNFKSAANSQDAMIVRNVSKGKFILRAAEKGQGSVRLRVNLVRRLLFEQRLFISAQCTETIVMLKSMKKSKNDAMLIDPKNPHKHAFDSIGYLLISESPIDEMERSIPTLDKPRSGIVTVGL